jgi:hypothetical protein
MTEGKYARPGLVTVLRPPRRATKSPGLLSNPGRAATLPELRLRQSEPKGPIPEAQRP